MLSEIKQQLQELEPTKPNLRKLGITFLVVLGLIGGFLWYKDRPAWPWLLGAGLAMGLWGLVWPAGLKPLYRLWMGLAVILGYFVSRILLTILFFLVLTPLGLIMKLAGKDPMDRKLGDGDSYWKAREPGQYKPQQTEKMY